MSVLAWIIVVVALLQLRAWRRRRAARAERVSRPRELRDAELMYMEKRFRTRRPIHLVAQLDRAYRAPDGALVLVELKTRWGGPQITDVIQLSAQRMAIEGHTGQRVASHAFVTIERPGVNRLLRWHRVQLLDDGQLIDLAHRRTEILDGRAVAHYAGKVEACHRCPYRSECGRFRSIG